MRLGYTDTDTDIDTY